MFPMDHTSAKFRSRSEEIVVPCSDYMQDVTVAMANTRSMHDDGVDVFNPSGDVGSDTRLASPQVRPHPEQCSGNLELAPGELICEGFAGCTTSEHSYAPKFAQRHQCPNS